MAGKMAGRDVVVRRRSHAILSSEQTSFVRLSRWQVRGRLLAKNGAALEEEALE